MEWNCTFNSIFTILIHRITLNSKSELNCLLMKKLISKMLLRLWGWKVELEGDPKELDRCILIVAPHTSNWDYCLGILTYWKLGKRLKVIIKDNHTKAFYGPIIKWIGAIGIDRSKKGGLIENVSKRFDKENFSLVITPEGSRSYAEKWRLGFYHMALSAKLPIVIATGDYQTKHIKIGYTIPYQELIQRSIESVLDEIQAYLKNIHPKFPEDFNPKLY